MKTCSKCKIPKPVDEFDRASGRKDGLYPQCKSCRRAYRDNNKHVITAQHRRRYIANQERLIAESRAWYKANKERASQRAHNYYLDNKDHALERAREWGQQNPGKVRAAKKKWKGQNPDAVAAHDHNRRARLLSAEGTYSCDDVAFLRKTQKGKCAHTWCRLSLVEGYHIDHIMPLALGGSNWRHNLQLLCPTCNLRKNAKHPVQFAQEHGMLL